MKPPSTKALIAIAALVVIAVVLAIVIPVVVIVVLPNTNASKSETAPSNSPTPTTFQPQPTIVSPTDTTGRSALTVVEGLKQKVPTCNESARKWMRIVFHDMATGALDASLQFELAKDGNSDAGFDPEIAFYRQFVSVSYSLSDIICLGGAIAVKVCNGGDVPVQLGRIDAKIASSGSLPVPDHAALASLDLMAQFNLTAAESVAVDATAVCQA